MLVRRLGRTKERQVGARSTEHRPAARGNTTAIHNPRISTAAQAHRTRPVSAHSIGATHSRMCAMAAALVEALSTAGSARPDCPSRRGDSRAPQEGRTRTRARRRRPDYGARVVCGVLRDDGDRDAGLRAANRLLRRAKPTGRSSKCWMCSRPGDVTLEVRCGEYLM